MERLYMSEFPGTRYRTCLVKEESDSDGSKQPRALHCSKDAFEYVKAGLVDMDREVMVSILLDTKNVPLGVNLVSIGDLNSAVVHPREVFKPAILASARGLVLAHNHPSGDPGPSSEDRQLTIRLKQSADILGINLLDHIIVGREGYHSMRDSGTIDWRPFEIPLQPKGTQS
jgi:DNA repair protein RadC